MSDQPTDKQEPKEEPRPQWADDLHAGLSSLGDDLRAGADQFRHEMPAARKKSRDGWIWGILLILGGGFLLLSNLTNYSLTNWWALFILIPALGSFGDAWSHYQDENRFSRRVRNALVSGVIFLCIALFFLLNLNFGRYWAVWLIVGGLVILINSLLPD